MDVPTDEIYKDLKGLGKGVIRIINYAKDLKSNYENLKEEAKKLLVVKNGILAETNKHKQKRLSDGWKNWITKVEKIIKDVQKLEAKYDKVKEKVNWFRRPKLSKKIENKCVELEKLRSEGEGFMGKLVAKPPEPIIPIDAEETADKPSLNKVIEEVLGDLQKTDISSIGLWGVPGIGKTNILKNLNNNKDVARMFDIVIWVDVRNYSREILQHAIARRLELDMEDKASPYEIASWIKADLEKKKCHSSFG